MNRESKDLSIIC